MNTDKNNTQLPQTIVSDSFYWTTEYYHHDNSFTMNDYLDNHLPDGAKIMFEEDSDGEGNPDWVDYYNEEEMMEFDEFVETYLSTQ